MATFAMRKEAKQGFDETLKRLPEALKAEGFGVLTEIDVSETLKKKLGVDFRRYRIVGACNPPFAHQALQANLEVGVMLPCNVAVWEADDGKTVVAAVDPSKTMAAADPQLADLAREVRTRLARVLETL